MKGKPKLKTRLPVSLMQRPSSDIDQGIFGPSTSSRPLIMTVNRGTNYERASGCNKAVQVMAKTTDKSRYCCLNKHKKVEKEEIDPFKTESTEEAIPSTQGSTVSTDISELASEINEEKGTQGKSFMLNLYEKKNQMFI